MKRKLVLFDIDGTILQSAGAGRRAIHSALSARGVDLASAGSIRFDGKTDPQIVFEILDASGDPTPDDPERISEVLELYLNHLEADLAESGHHSRLLPGIPALLDRLESDPGVVLGLLTGNVVTGARLKLRAAGLDPGRFTVGAYGSDHRHRGELPAIAALRAAPQFGRVPQGTEVVILGDTPADVRCCEGIGARAVAVATGGYSVAELLATGASAVFPDFAEVERVVEVILS